MSDDGFRAEVVPGGEGPTIRLRGTLNRGAKEVLEDAYHTVSESSGEVVLDFSAVDYINSTGIAVVVGILAMARADGREVGARGLTDHYREVFQITRLSDFMHIYENVTA